MNTRPPQSSFCRSAAFSLIEIIIVVGLLSVITLGLFAMFSQTQRVFRTGVTQVDVLESGRAVTEMLSRELQQIRPSHEPNTLNFFAVTNTFNPLTQKLPGAGTRLNIIQDFFFLTRENQEWVGIGYRVSNPTDGLGTLYRYEFRTNATLQPGGLYNSFYFSPLEDGSRVLDGVVHLQLRAYNQGGMLITNNISGQNNSFVRTNSALGGFDDMRFWSNAVPAFVEFEIGILEDRARRRAESIPDSPDPTPRRNFLAEQAGKVHLFRYRVPVRNVDAAAYK
jgi:type II secretory pathway pseudopilin PulG